MRLTCPRMCSAALESCTRPRPRLLPASVHRLAHSAQQTTPVLVFCVCPYSTDPEAAVVGHTRSRKFVKRALLHLENPLYIIVATAMISLTE